MRKRKTLFCAAAALTIAAAACILLAKYSLPGWIPWQTKTISEDERTIVLKKRKISVYDGKTQIWKTEDEIPVQDVLYCDIDHDEQKELMLLCWKRGRYGKHRPFWVKQDEHTWSQHIYIYDWNEDGIRAIWMASDIGRLAVDWSFDEYTRLTVIDRNGIQTNWDWKSWGLSYLEPQKLTFGALGDNLIHSRLYDYAFRHFDGNFDYLFTSMLQELSAYDVTSINQETIYVDKPEQYSSYPRFGTPIQVGQAVADAGFDIVSCATNHTLDKGLDAIDLTADFYERNGILYAGIQKSSELSNRPYEILERNGIRCAVFSYTAFTNGNAIPKNAPFCVHTLDDEQQVRRDLLAGKRNADAVIVYVHWGTEYDEKPDEFQLYWAKVFSDCGATVVIGTHPHVVQKYEMIDNTLVYYSLGNYISAQESEPCRKGALAYFTLCKLNGVCTVTEYGTKPLLTTVQNGLFSTAPDF